MGVLKKLVHLNPKKNIGAEGLPKKFKGQLEQMFRHPKKNIDRLTYNPPEPDPIEPKVEIMPSGTGVSPLVVTPKSKYINSSYKVPTISPPLVKELKFSKGGSVERKLYKEGGKPSMEDQMEGLAISVEPVTVEKEETHTMPDGTIMPGKTHEEYEQMLPDEEMEEDYVDYVVSSTLEEEDQNYLESALAEDAKLSELFDQVVESASEFSGSGPVEGLGSGVSDSIPARLSDGEFVFTAKATEEIGEDSLMSMMKDAEAAADKRQGVVHGGVIDEEERAVPIQTRGSVAAQGNVPNVVKQSRQVEEEMLKSSPRRYYVPVSG